MKPPAARHVFPWAASAILAAALLPAIGCGGSGQRSDRQFVSMGTAPMGGAFAPVGNAITSVVNENRGESPWRAQSHGTMGSQHNIRLLDQGVLQLGMSNAAISYYAYHGELGWEKEYEIRAVVTLAPNVGLFITRQESGIRTMADLKGKRVTVGPAGAGFEMFVGPLMTEHGVAYLPDRRDFTPINQNYSDSVQLLGDGSVDACFMGGAIPTPAVTQASTTYDVFFIPYDEEVRRRLIEKYPFFREALIPAKTRDGKDTYRGLDDDFPSMDVGSMHLITHERVDEELVYRLTKLIWENRADIAQQHPAARAINERNAVRNTGIPFHPGAIRFYREIGIWPDDSPSGEGAPPSAPGKS